MKNPTTQSVLVTLYVIAEEINVRPISARYCGMQALLNVAEAVAETGEISPELGVALITEARNLLK